MRSYDTLLHMGIKDQSMINKNIYIYININAHIYAYTYIFIHIYVYTKRSVIAKILNYPDEIL